ncbi:UvrD-helicase domain-containing protein [Arenimonas caeni]|uniref:UvrD-helicase domain-containing protein n=1 Tax=Arenimonas caeni TaxID=2058085 RepID=UPI0013B057EC|nr:UvrD-helicase domain-containing protein [Arenimonas caeni]
MSGPVTVAHWRDLPLGPGGRALVEASAGTGKTWTIGVLWWRLLLEPTEPLSVQQIVVTTFTDAAAQELRERLRQRLHQALALAAERPAPEAAKGEDEAWLLSRWTNDDATHAEDLRRLRLALADFDRAPIRTLHGLCQGILAEHPLESGHGTEPAEPTSGAALLDELARDAWRVLRQSDGGALGRAGDPEMKLSGFSAKLRSLLRPGVRIVAGKESWAEVVADLAPTLLAPLRELADEPAWFTRKNAKLRNALLGLVEGLGGQPWKNRDDNLETLLAIELDGQVKPDRLDEFAALPVLASLRAAVPRLLDSRHVAEQRFWLEQLARVTAWRDQRLAARGQTTFDEMIRQAHAAVASRPALADALFADWPVALVDEFQDTDDQQYGILDRLYRGADDEPRGRLVMIGDPKQAIYGFRGGDVHAYLRAREHAGHRLSLDTNHRSSATLVEAVNGLYAAAGERLSSREDDAIRYEAVKASDRQAQTPYLIDGQPVAAPLALHLWRNPPAAQPERKRAALKACAAHIATLLADPAQTIDHKRAGKIVRERVAPGDIAVLLPTNNDISALRTELLRLNVPCVGGARASVFDSDWAFELQVLLQALASPEDEGVLRAAVLTRLWGGTLAQVAALAAGEDAGDAIGERLQQLRALWRREGVLPVVLALAEAAAPRLLAHAGGERDLTDLRHLGELLQQQAEAGLGPHALLAWLAEQRLDEDGEAPDSEERQLRIESDARRVQLMTLHRAKGLEFPIVFLPLMWAHAWSDRQGAPYLLPAGGQPGREARFDPAARELAKHEAQDERFRVLYVALTRAIHACHVYALPPDRPKDKRSSAAPTDPERSPLDAMLERLGVPAALPALPGASWLEGWPADAAPLARDAGGNAAREALPMPTPARLRQRLSFSALVGGARRSAEEEAPADDEAEPLAPEPVEDIDDTPHPALLALASVRGPAFGNAVHLAFETRDHDKPFARQPALLARQLALHGVRASGEPLEALVPRLAAQLDAALQAELLPGLRLGDVPPAKQRAEMAFHFALDGARLEALRAACAAHGEPGLVPPLAWGELRGLMTGKIDLVFEHAGRVHVLDYKGNWLGERLGDYQGAALAQAMDQHHYRLQALLYTVAVHRYLGQRLAAYSPEKHLGEAIYLFVRAAGHAPGAGVWTQAFDPALVRAVNAVFSAQEAAA